MEYKGLTYLQNKLKHHEPRVSVRYRYYEMKEHVEEFGLMAKDNYKGQMQIAIGWPAKAVDALAERLNVLKWQNDDLGIEDIFNENSSDILYDSAITGSLITSCDFIYVSQGDNGEVHLQVIDGHDATGVLDPFTYMLTEGYAVLERDDYGLPIREAYFTRESTAYYDHGKLTEEIDNPADYAMLVPVIYRPGARRPFGHSRISRSVMDLTAEAVRILSRTDTTADFYTSPQRYALGVDKESEAAIRAYIRSMHELLAIGTNKNGQIPQVGQFSQASMQPHLEQLKMTASLLAGETGLTLDDLGFPSDNPSSADAIKAAHESLRSTAERAQKVYGICFRNAGYLGACLRDGVNYDLTAVTDTKLLWYPVFPVDSSSLGAIGDGLSKLAAAFPDTIDTDTVMQLTGLDMKEGLQPWEI